MRSFAICDDSIAVFRYCKMVRSTHALCALQVVELEMHSGTVDICLEVAEVFA